MKLPFFKNQEEKQNYYLALLLLDEKANAVILEEVEGKIKIVGKHEAFFSDSIESIPQEEFISIIDKTISSAENTLPPNIETHKTVFGVKENWIEAETKKIKKDYLAKLKKVCGEINLTPLGFMVTSEAIAHLMQEEEGAPLSAVFVDLGKVYASITLYRGGKVIENVNGELGESPVVSVDKLLQHFTTPVLPARIILFHAQEGDRLPQQFISHQWTKTIPFLHMPQITILPEGFDARAVIAGAATQMGLEVMNQFKDLKPQDINPLESKEEQNKTQETPLTQYPDFSKTEGYEENQKIHDEHKEHHKSPPHHSEHTEITKTAEDFGFIFNQDIGEKNKHILTEEPTPQSSHHPYYVAHHSEEPNFVVSNEPEEEIRNEQPEKPSILEPILSSFKKIKLPTFGNFHLPGGLLKFLIPIIVLIVAIIGLIFFYFFKTKVTIALNVKPKVVGQTATITFSTTSPSDFSKNIIAAKAVSTSIKGELSKAATGKKDVGDKAKGAVTIYNNSDELVIINSGTSIKSSNGLNFITDKDVKVASASGDVFSGTKPGTAQVNISAEKLGTEYNLPSGTKFSIGANSSLAAKNDSAFSGGTKKSVTVVSKDDLAKLKEELPKSLESKARESLAQKVGNDETILPIFLDTSLDKTNFDKDVGDEASKVKLSATVSFNTLTYQNGDLSEYAKSLLKNHYSQEITFADNSVKATVKETKVQNEKEAQTKVMLTAGLLPNIDIADIKNRLKGKSPSETKEFVDNLPQVMKSTLIFSPNIPFFANLFPRLPNTVDVVVKSK